MGSLCDGPQFSFTGSFLSDALWRLLPRAGPVIFLPHNICIKSTSFTRLAEASAMRLVAAHTTVPFPKVYTAFNHKGSAVMVSRADRNVWRLTLKALSSSLV